MTAWGCDYPRLLPHVSIIIPAHNAAPFLEATLRSVYGQTFTDWEIVAVDDGSSDDTWSVLQSDPARIRALRSPTPTGPAAARNLALSGAQGELVAFLDADDLLLPNYLESQIRCLENATTRGARVGFVTCDALVLENDVYAERTYLSSRGYRGRPLTLERVLRKNPIYGACLVPEAVGASVGWFDPELFGTEDFGLWVKILERGYDAIVNPVPLAVYRRHAGTVSSNLARQALNAQRVYQLALTRKSLNGRQRRIARKAVRHNRAIEAVARMRFGQPQDRSLARLIQVIPVLAWVVVTNPQSWAQWWTILTRRSRSDSVPRGIDPARQPHGRRSNS